MFHHVWCCFTTFICSPFWCHLFGVTHYNFFFQGFESNNLTFLLLCISNHLHLVQSLWGLWLWIWLKRKHVLLSPCCSVTKSLRPFHRFLSRGGQLIYPRGHVRNWAPWVNELPTSAINTLMLYLSLIIILQWETTSPQWKWQSILSHTGSSLSMWLRIDCYRCQTGVQLLLGIPLKEKCKQAQLFWHRDNLIKLKLRPVKLCPLFHFKPKAH